MRSLVSGICLSLLVAAGAVPASADARAELGRARAAYNDGQYDVAITAASAIPSTSPEADAARLVVGRAHLEQFRRTQDPGDLAAARTAFQALHPANLSPRDRLQLVAGLGESLFLQGMFGPAADLFRTALAMPEPSGPGDRDQLLDWWATAVDREALGRSAGRREPLYHRLADEMQDVQQTDPSSGVAAYWAVAADCGAGRLDDAWNGAIASWVRAPMMGPRGATLRTDLDRLMIVAIIPGRARQLAPAPPDAADIAADLRAEWEVVKRDWP
ncbi:MAG: hypothetical protein KGN76_07595 [Acidobacteriota bacterium]|nr:hypothetical protein [Acidobacteriota bacterium]